MAGSPQDGGDFTSIGRAQQEINDAMAAMRGNIEMMSSRDERLHGLENKSNTLQGTANAFTRQAKRLQWEMKWRKIRLAAAVVLLLIWAICFFIFRKSLLPFLITSGIVFAIIFFLQAYLTRRWRAQMEAEERMHLPNQALD
eukprot:TRINITY_DN64357_c0_g1_i1.p1 TRINITY_DN64357_c0_g1~~TRINITY_DN64357_c0_g1_i1.p1  ORF type:complete len:160 (-),score=19.96 TRINITY_DN64357_c0_g1_i1:70-495(-)